MRSTLYLKFIILYVIFGFLSLFTAATLTSGLETDARLYCTGLTEDGAEIKGTQAKFLSPQPAEIGLGDSIGVFPLVSTIEDAHIEFK